VTVSSVCVFPTDRVYSGGRGCAVVGACPRRRARARLVPAVRRQRSTAGRWFCGGAAPAGGSSPGASTAAAAQPYSRGAKQRAAQRLASSRGRGVSCAARLARLLPVCPQSGRPGGDHDDGFSGSWMGAASCWRPPPRRMRRGRVIARHCAPATSPEASERLESAGGMSRRSSLHLSGACCSHPRAS
jgi:hypothetical protein